MLFNSGDRITLIIDEVYVSSHQYVSEPIYTVKGVDGLFISQEQARQIQKICRREPITADMRGEE